MPKTTKNLTVAQRMESSLRYGRLALLKMYCKSLGEGSVFLNVQRVTDTVKQLIKPRKFKKNA